MSRWDNTRALLGRQQSTTYSKKLIQKSIRHLSLVCLSGNNCIQRHNGVVVKIIKIEKSGIDNDGVVLVSTSFLLAHLVFIYFFG